MGKSVVSSSPEATRLVVDRLAKRLHGGDVLGLVGPLGAGKTTAVQFLAHTLGIPQRPRSPSYTLLQPYQLPREIRGIRTLVHVDAYRVAGTELMDAGLADYLADPHATIVVEWADRIAEHLPPNTKWVHIEPGGEPNARTIRIGKAPR